MFFVLDNSVTMRWLFGDGSAQAQAYTRTHQAHASWRTCAMICLMALCGTLAIKAPLAATQASLFLESAVRS